MDGREVGIAAQCVEEEVIVDGIGCEASLG